MFWIKNKFEQIKKRPRKIFILTGSGVSKKSGIPTFREKNGFWNEHNIEKVALSTSINDHPAIFFSFHNNLTEELNTKKPNDNHYYLSRLEEICEVIIITQNIDLLHEAAGSNNVIHMHGQIKDPHCHLCKRKYEYKKNIYGEKCTKCDGKIRPNITLINENVKYQKEIFKHLMTSDLFLQIGTSASIMPASEYAKSFDGYKINISKDSPKNISYFNIDIRKDATKALKKLYEHLITL